MSYLINGLNALDHAIPAYREAESFYNGNETETFTSTALKKALGSESSEFVMNYSRLVVTSRLDRMEVSAVVSEDGSADDLLGELWSSNSMDAEVQDAIESALVYGDSYLIADVGENSVDIFYNDPLSTRVFYSVENPKNKEYAIKRWLQDEKLRVNLYFPDRIEKYISKGKPSTSMKEGDFEAFYDEDSDAWPIVNETGQIPVFHLRTGRQYGQPEHKQSYGPQRAITKLISTQISSIDFATAPQRYFLEDPAANDGVNPIDDFGGRPGVAPDTDDDDAVSNLKAGPGGVWSLKGIKEVGQFDAPNPDSFVVPFKTFVEAMSTVTKTPTHTFNVGALPSGESLRAAEAPLNKRVLSLETMLGSALADVHQFALSALGVEAKVLVQWAAPASYDDKDVWEVVNTKTAAGVPLRQALMEAGYTDEQVTEWYPEGDTQPRTVEQLVKFGDALQKISAAVTLGLITKEEARAALPQDILTQLPTVDPESVIEAINNSLMEE